MESILLANKVSAIIVWVIFWGFVAGIRLVKKYEFQNLFSGIKKMPSAAIWMFTFFTVLNFVLAEPRGSMIGKISAPWLFVLIELFGYAGIISGFIFIMQVAWTFQKQLAPGPKLDIFKYLQIKMYLGTLLIAFGSSLIFLNPLGLIMSIALFPFIVHRIKIEREVNSTI